jgi:hypothetical protein
MKLIKKLLLVSSVFCLSVSAFAQTWTLASPPDSGCVAIACSADGNKLVALLATSYVYIISTNSGANWVTNSEPQMGSSIGSWNSIASSADGTRLVATSASSSLWASTNSGATWISNNVTGVSAWKSVALSAEGTKVVAVDGGSSVGLIYTSTNSGITWNSTIAPANPWISVASSADGTKLAAASGEPFGGPGYPSLTNAIYISTNSGMNWTQTMAPSNVWVSIASSADGTVLVAAAQLSYTYNINNPFIILSPSGIWTSTDSGTTWISNNVPSAPAGWQAVASSADGAKLVAVADSSLVSISTNSGTTWNSNNVANAYWLSVASSADGNKLMAGSWGIGGYIGGVFISQVNTSPQLNLIPSLGNLTLGWTVSSTNFVLQQSSDLSSWTDLTNTPVLNLTNLQNEVILSPTNSSSFYRLATP